MQMGWRLALIWACFVVRLFFYSATLPLWEGYDEWAHFAVIRAMAVHGKGLVGRQATIPRDVEATFGLAPVPWEMRSLAPPAVTQDAYWQLPAEERSRRTTAMRNLPVEWRREDGTAGFTAYEALQPPLYYWLMAPVLRVLSAASLVGQVLVLRLLSSLVASFTIPLLFFLGKLAFEDDRVALGCAAVAAVMPGFALDVARVGNDCLAVTLFTLLTCLAVRITQSGLNRRLAVWTGLTLGLGLLTKAYFLTAIPPILGVVVHRWSRVRADRRGMAGHTLLLASLSILTAGWWYVRNLRTTGTLSGLSESVLLRDSGLAGLLGHATDINWAKAIDAILFSHLYFGGWSSLTVRSWMYHLFYLFIGLAAVGLLRAIPGSTVRALLGVYLTFWAGQLYNVILLYMSKGLAGSMGWYMYAVVGAEMILCLAGLRRLLPERLRGWPVRVGVVLFALLDLYTVHFLAIPYYSGMIRHKVGGAMGALHGADFQAVGFGAAFERLAGLKPGTSSEAILIIVWVAYLAATLFLMLAVFEWKWGRHCPQIGATRLQSDENPHSR